MARARRSDREDVIASHLERVRTFRQAVAGRLELLPGPEVQAELVRRDQELAAVDHALTVLLPAVWHLERHPPRKVPRAVEGKVLIDIRSTAAVLVMRLEERRDRLSAAEERDLAAARALYRYSATALRSLGTLDPLGPLLEGAGPFDPLG